MRRTYNQGAGDGHGRRPGPWPANAAGPGRCPPPAAAALLELVAYRVTKGQGGQVGVYEIAGCHCGCWFCADCCKWKGLDLRRDLIPILETFSGLMMLTFTVDPSLFATPAAAYAYMMKRRCIARTIQDMHRQGFLAFRGVTSAWWNGRRRRSKCTSMFLVDATRIPWDNLLASWSKHRPASGGPVVGDRPAFGTVLFSKRDFAGGPAHAARYATKYLVKVPEQGFPAWVLALGAGRRVRRYSTSRGFWNQPAKVSRKTYRKRQLTRLSYGDASSGAGKAPTSSRSSARAEKLGRRDAGSAVCSRCQNP